MAKAHPLFLEITAEIRMLARDRGVDWGFAKEVWEAMERFELDLSDVVCALQGGVITEGQTAGERWVRLYRVEGTNCDGVCIAFIVRYCAEENVIEIISVHKL